MSLAAGKLRHRVVIEQLSRYIDSAGDTIEAWMTLAEVWAAVEPVSGREFIASQAAQSAVSVRVTVRHRTDVTAAMRLTFRSKVYVIEAILPDKVSGLEYDTLLCSEGVSES